MRVLYDHEIFTFQSYGGISRYFAELIAAQHDYQLALKVSDNQYLHELGIAQKLHLESSKRPPSFPGLIRKYGRNESYFRRLLRKADFDLVHLTFYPMLDHTFPKPFVITIHDMIPELYPQYFTGGLYGKLISSRWIRKKRELAQKAGLIIAVSKNTKKDIVRLYGIAPDKIKVIHHANSLIQPPTECSLNLPGKYLLYVGTRNHYKNFKRFAEAAALLMKKDSELFAVCIGGAPFSPEETSYLDALGITSRFRQYTAGSNDLWHIYNGAGALVFPSLYEGFGLPVLEAFHAGTPAILSNTSSLPEVGGEAGVYFDPLDSGDMAQTIASVIYDPEKRKEMIKAGKQRNQLFSWEKTTKETLDAYARLLKTSA